MTDYTEKAREVARSALKRRYNASKIIEAALREAHEAGRMEQAQWRPIGRQA